MALEVRAVVMRRALWLVRDALCGIGGSEGRELTWFTIVSIEFVGRHSRICATRSMPVLRLVAMSEIISRLLDQLDQLQRGVDHAKCDAGIWACNRATTYTDVQYERGDSPL